MKYLCYDTALNEEYTLILLLKTYPQNISLFYGTDDEKIWDAAPYIFNVNNNFFLLRDGSPLVSLQHCIVFETNEPKEEVVRFLQSYFYKKTIGGLAYFRVWDARVLLRSFPAWPLPEKKKFFEFFSCFYTECDEDTVLVKWQMDTGNKLIGSKVVKADVLPDIAPGNNEEAEKEPGQIKARTDPPTPEQAEAPVNEKPRQRRFFF